MGEAIKVAEVADIEAGEAIVLSRDVTGTQDDVALVKTEDGEIFAIDNTCTHALASLAEGWVEGETVECPLHAAAFCLKTGAALTLPATEPVTTHAVDIRGDEVYITPGSVQGEL